MVSRPRSFVPALAVALVAVAGPAGAQRSDAFLDPAAESLFRSAQENWFSIDESVVRYTAVIKQRIAAGIRTPLKDRTLYRNESAVRAFWDRDHDALVQVLGARSQHPGQEEVTGALAWLDDLTIDDPFEPGGDRLFFGLGGDDEDIYSPDNEDFWFAHPLAQGADTLYRYQSGDTLTLSLPDGRRLLTVQLDVLPREADVHRISGTLWIEPEEGALVRGVYRLSRELDVMRDIEDVRREAEAGEFDMVPGILKPWVFELSVVAVDYSLWDFEIWLPRSMRMEGEVRVGVLKMPIEADVSYQMESVTTVADLESAAAAQAPAAGAPLEERHFETREEAMAFLATLLTDEYGTRYAPVADATRTIDGRTARFLAPEDPSILKESPHLPPPVWEAAPGFASEEELEEMFRTLADLPPVPTQGIPWDLNWGWAREDLLRYNRVEGPAIGGRFEAELGSFLGPLEFRASGFFGFADLMPKARLELERASVFRRVAVGAYHELRPTDPGGRYLGLGNSLNAFFFGRDDGEYFMASGADLLLRPVETERPSWKLRVYGERQRAVSNEIDFALFRAFDGDGTFRPNLQATDLDEAGGELTLSPWWGSNPVGVQGGIELYGQGAAWRLQDSTAFSRDYGRASAIFRLAVPVATGSWRVGIEAGGGTSWGDLPLQRMWLLGGPATLRGYPASVLQGSSFARGRLEVAQVEARGAVAWTAFGDVGWAGDREEIDVARPLYAAGVGISVLDGLIRMDVSHGLRGPQKRLRFDMYLDAIL